MAEGRIIIKGENNISSSVKSAQKDLNSLNSTVQNLSKTFKTAFTATAILAGLNKIAKTVTNLAKEYLEVEQSISRLNSSSTLYGQNLSSLNRIIDTFSKQTMESKDTVREMVSELSALGKSESEISKITEASVALSNVTGKSLTESFNQMLSTLKGEVGELAKLDTSFANLTSEQLKHGDAVDEVIKKYGELSKSMADSSFGQNWKDIKDTFSTIKQSSGKVILQFAEDIGFVNIITNLLESIDTWLSKIYLKQIGVYDLYEDEVTKALNLEKLGNDSAEAQEIIDNIYSKVFQPYFQYDIKKNYQELVDRYGKDNIPQEELDSLFQPFRDVLTTYFPELISNINAIGSVIEEQNKVERNEARYEMFNSEIQVIEESLKDYIDEQGRLTTEWLNKPYKADGSKSDAYWDLTQSPVEYSFVIGGKNTIIDSKDENGVNKGLNQFIKNLTNTLNQYKADYERDIINYKTPETRYVEYNSSYVDTGLNSYLTAKEEEAKAQEEQAKIQAEEERLNSLKPTSYSDKTFRFALKKTVEPIEKNTDTTLIALQDSAKKQEEIASILDTLPEDFESILPDFGYDTERYLEYLTKIAGQVDSGNYVGAGANLAFEENISNIIAGLGLDVTELVDGYNALFTSAADGLFAAIQPLTDIIFSANPLLALILVILQDFVETLLPAIETVLAPVMDFLGSIGKLLAQTLYPVLEALYPWITMIVNVLANLVYPIIQMITPVMQVIAGILEALKPVLSIVLEAFTAIAIVLNWVAGLFEYVGDIVVTFGQNVGIALWNVLHPFDQKSYKSTTKSYKSFNQSANEVMQSNSNAFSGSVDLATSTSTAVQNASYSGGGTVTINIYQQGVVVGDNGMEEFARMIRTEFASLDYYGT